MHRYRWFNSIHWGPCYDPERKAHFASATDFKTLNETYGPVEAASCQVWFGEGAWKWANFITKEEGGTL